MNIKKTKVKAIETILVLLVLILSVFDLTPAKQDLYAATENKESKNESLLKRLNHPSMKERLNALFEINETIDNHLLTEEIKERILHLAEAEHKSEESLSKGELGEQYQSQLIAALGNTRDSRAVPYLLNYLGGGTAVARSLHKIGEPAIDPLIKKLHDEVVGYRSSAAYALGLYLKPEGEGYIAKGEIREKIKQALLKELKDPRNKEPEKSIAWYEVRANERAGVRRILVRGLGYIAETGDNDVLPIIKSAAVDDPYFLDMSKKKNYQGPQKRFVVREEAQKVLDGLKAKRIEKKEP